MNSFPTIPQINFSNLYVKISIKRSPTNRTVRHVIISIPKRKKK